LKFTKKRGPGDEPEGGRGRDSTAKILLKQGLGGVILGKEAPRVQKVHVKRDYSMQVQGV